MILKGNRRGVDDENSLKRDVWQQMAYWGEIPHGSGHRIRISSKAFFQYIPNILSDWAHWSTSIMGY